MITSSVAFYPCVNLLQTEDFYTRIIGLKTVFSSDTVRIFSTNRGYFAFVQYGDGEAAKGKLCLSLNCASREEVDAEYARILKTGFSLKSQPAKHPFQPVYSFFLEDPNGYTVEFEKLDGWDL